MPVTSGVYPCYENQFKVDVSNTTTASFKTIADMETFSVSFDNGVEEWTPFEQEGWVRRLLTGKGITITVNGKRNIGDDGNDFIADMFMKNGRDAEADIQWTFPDGGVLLITDAVINVTNIGAGDSTAVGPLEFEIMSNGKPTYTPAA
ncbi:MAG: hypothetical protein IJI68_09930 [Eggerthellaceae bacterium]|nr:hypothetical protein [Eggerthellaceae bacterium]